MKKITELIHGKFEAITLACFVRDNNVLYSMPKGFGYMFSDIVINDPRFVSETITVHNRSL